MLYEDTMNSGFGERPCRGYFLLTHFGYPKVKVLHGGLGAWKRPACRWPLTPAPVAATFLLAITPGAVMIDRYDGRRSPTPPSSSSTCATSTNGWARVLAVRTRLRAAQGAPAQREVDRVVPPDEAHAAGPMFKSAMEVRAELRTAGITPDSTIYLYCFGGRARPTPSLALKGIRLSAR